MKKLMIIGLMWMIILGVFVAAECAPKPEGIIAWWHDENINQAVDIIGGNNLFTYKGIEFQLGKVGYALGFDGKSSKGHVTHTDSLNLKDSYTIEAWIKPTNLNAYQVILGKGDSTPAAPALYLYGDSQIKMWYSSNSQGAWWLSSTTLNPKLVNNQWFHLAVTYGGKKGTVYINGVNVFSKDNLPVPDVNTNDWYIGYLSEKNQPNYFSGLIDELSLYNTALSAAEIKAIYDAGSDGKCAPKLVCEQNAQYCDPIDKSGGVLTKECNQMGTDYLAPANCPNGGTCYFGSKDKYGNSFGKCTNPCNANQWTCVSNIAKKQCNEKGTDYLTPVNCAQGEKCSAGVCAPENNPNACVGNLWYCEGETAKKQCNEKGTDYLSPVNCGQGEKCSAGVCALENNPNACVGNLWYCEGETARKQCNEKGTDYLQPVSCAQGETCTKGVCAAQQQQQQQEEQVCTDIKALQPTDKTLATTIIDALKNNDFIPLQKLQAIMGALITWLSG